MIDPKKQLGAFFHDPLDKPLHIQGHEERAAQQAALLGVARAAARGGDHAASAADRFPDMKAVDGSLIMVDFLKAPEIRHPLGSGVLDLAQEGGLAVTSDQASAAATGYLEKLRARAGDNDEKTLLALWREFPEAVRDFEDERCRMGELWSLLPADTRVPDHSLLHHNWLTAAYDSCGEELVFAKFWIGPVQGFIASARRTEDYWMGSYLLSWLMSRAVIRVIRELGPAHIIFPNVKGDPQVDRFLSEEFGIEVGDDFKKRLLKASLPNVLFFIAPAHRFAAISKQMEEDVHKSWAEVADTVKAKCGLAGFAAERMDEQTRRLIETGYAGVRVTATDAGMASLSERIRAAGGVMKPLAGPFRQNVGTRYQEIYGYLDKIFTSNKLIRRFPPLEESGFKCSQCGENGVLAPDESTALDNAGLRKWWADLAAIRNMGFRLAPDGRERLCGVCLTKRFAYPDYFRDKLPEDAEETGFPSVASVATWSFRLKVLDNWDRLCGMVRSLMEALQGVNLGYSDLPKHIRTKINKLSVEQDLARKFLRMDGQWLFEDLILDEDGINEAQRRCIREAVCALRKALGAKPAKYYAIIRMDGDKMGEWLTGSRSGWPTWRKVVHTRMSAANEELLDGKRHVAPAVHSFVSLALNRFALEAATEIVENEFPGKLVYSGGDDVLAILPLDCALACAEKLRFRFSGQIARDGGIDLARTSGFVVSERGGRKRVAPTMGRHATMSAGIVIAHVRANMQSVITRTGACEHLAKDGCGRDAVAVTILKRSGSELTFAAKWLAADRRFVPAMERFLALLGEEKLSMKFCAALDAMLRPLSWNRKLFAALRDGVIADHIACPQAEKKQVVSAATTALDDIAACVAATQRDALRGFIDAVVAARFLASHEVTE